MAVELNADQDERSGMGVHECTGLSSHGVDASRMSTAHDGEVKPAVSCPEPGKDPDTCLNREEHQLNRRVVIVVEY